MLVEPKDIFQLFSTLTPYIGWWEYDYYIGWAGAIFVAGSLFLAWRTKIYLKTAFHKLVFPCLVMVTISIGRLYKPIFMLPFPLVNGERVASRFLIIPMLFLIFAASVYAQRTIDYYKPTSLLKGGLISLFLIVLNDLQQHLELWSPSQLEKYILPVAQNPADYYLNFRSDPMYVGIIIAGTIISILTLIGLILCSKWHSKSAPKSQPVEMDMLS